jgi:RNA polymerase sigma-70 factor, ECF subfamily
MRLEADESMEPPASPPTVVEDAAPATPTQIGFGQLVRDNLDLVWRSVRRLGVPQADAEDATQEVFLVAKDKMGQINAGSERAFLLAVAARVAGHARRGQMRRANAYGRFSVELPEQRNPGAREVGRLEARDLLDRVLDAMPEHIRVVFVLFEFEDFSVSKIAEVLEIPKGTAATRLRRARELFKEHAARLGTHLGETHQ